MGANGRISVTNIFNDDTIYVIPAFQRPYAWEETQWDELIDDIRIASHREPKDRYHYFAPLHVIKIADPEHSLWQNYVANNDIQDIVDIADSGFRSQRGSLNVFLVIDGQQRLVTLYSLLHQYFPRFVTLSINRQVPAVILNEPSDHISFRNLLGLRSPAFPGSHESRAQGRLASLFKKFSTLLTTDPVFSPDNLGHKFITSGQCETLRIELDATARLAAFMTLNDRGKRLTNLEKTKSLLMEIDDNGQKPDPIVINNTFGSLYRTLESKDAYIDDDESLRQVGMTLWEGGNLSQISGVTWSLPADGKNRNNSIHQIGSNSLYDDYLKALPQSIASITLEKDIIPAIRVITNSHDDLTYKITPSRKVKPLGFPSFTQKLGFHARDAIDDYHAILLSLGLQSKQIGFLFLTRQRFPHLEWHEPIGSHVIDNTSIKQSLAGKVGEIKQYNHNIAGISPMIDACENEINKIPDVTNREYTALQIAESLRLIVGNAKPGTFSSKWNYTFRVLSSCNINNFVSEWIDYITAFGSRDAFINTIANSTYAFNNNHWVKYLLSEYEFSLSGINPHRNQNFEIEHFFPSSWGESQHNSDVLKHNFSSVEQYKQSFVDQIGNKLLLAKSLNGAIKDAEPLLRTDAYRTQSFGSVNVMTTNPSASAIEIGTDLLGSTKSHYRVYVQLRSLRLAAFAARRF
ncbi:MAG: GmrSD restriction endonuclease domain-containing protein [Syntrophobacteraceae bacterium]